MSSGRYQDKAASARRMVNTTWRIRDNVGYGALQRTVRNGEYDMEGRGVQRNVQRTWPAYPRVFADVDGVFYGVRESEGRSRTR